jgi:alpha-D-ribose 1-methylphosphonate 5-triphosphate diphosphatase
LAALQLARDGVLDFAAAWALVSSGPARMLGLTDRGVLEPGRRADLVVLDAATGLVGACIAGGCVAYMAGDVAARFLA